MATTYLIKNITHEAGNVVLDSLVLERDQSAFINSLSSDVMRAYSLGMISVDAVNTDTNNSEPMTREDIINLLGFEPYDESNPDNFSRGTVMGITIENANGFTSVINNNNSWPLITLDLQLADSTHNGKLSSTDWNTFNNKQSELGFIPYDSSNPQNFISHNENITITGDVEGSGTNAIILSLKNIVSGGTATKFTFNEKGLITSATDLSSSDIISFLGFTPYNSTNPNSYISHNETITITGDVLGSGKTSLNLTLASVVAAGTGSKITYNAKGLVTGSSNLVFADIISFLGFTPYNATNPNGYTSNTGTVTNISVVNANGFSATIATSTTTPAITLTLQNASSTQDGKLSAVDWVTFNSKQSALVSGTTLKTIDGISLLGAGDIPLNNKNITVTGDISGSGTTSLNLTLPDIVAPNTFTKITYNSKGQVTAGSNLLVSDIPNLDFSKIVSGKPNSLAGYGILDAQVLLVSGTNIKTINNTSILGTGDITIPFSSLTGKPTTLSGYGITDAQASLTSGTNIKTINSFSVLGSGNIDTTPTFAQITSKPTTLSGYGIIDAQPLATDLTNIVALSGTNGLLRKTATNTWSLDTNTYYKSGDNIVANLVGVTTNSNAASGVVGEYIESSVASGSAVALTTVAASNMASISLTAGDWDVTGTIAYKAGALTTVVFYQQGISSTNATFGAVGTYTNLGSVSIGGGLDFAIDVPIVRFSLATTTTIYFVARASFTLGTLNVYGNIRARRVR